MTAVLVANRGEIARRIFRTAKVMGFRTIAAYSDADANAPFVREADAAVRLGPAPARDSYLSIERVIAVARESGAELVHPGYGFLAESPALARACAKAGLRFVGPPAEVLAALGDKARAKAIAERANVPVLPGYAGADQRDETFLVAAKRTGYPVMVKPVAGGGGIGMQTVRGEAELRDALARARRGAMAAFDDERLLLERFVTRPRHVEVQVLADDGGTVIALGERDCSAQRRHQKILEETPAPRLDDATRSRLAAAASALAKAAGYRNAGTVEFIIDDRGNFFFLELNARLQVEHPVTELVWGVDLVEQQLRIAQGEPLALGAKPRGHAIEVRLYAEDPAAGFLPSTGTLVHIAWPEGVRVDAGYEQGDALTRFYDPLLAKLVARGPDREAALTALAEALERTAVLGVRTNRDFLRRLVAHPAVRDGGVDTEFVERELAQLVPPRGEAAPAVTALAAAALVEDARANADPRDPWEAMGAWRAGEGKAATVTLGERAYRVIGDDPFTVEGHAIAADPATGGWLVDGEAAIAARAGGKLWVSWRGETYELETAAPERDVDAIAGAEVAAPMPGVVLAANARADQQVKRGDLLFVVEAMKMELRVEAPADGVVRRVLAAAGDLVERGQRLAEFEPS